MAAFGTDADEILVEGAKALRGYAGPNEYEAVKQFNEFMAAYVA